MGPDITREFRYADLGQGRGGGLGVSRGFSSGGGAASVVSAPHIARAFLRCALPCEGLILQ